MASGSDNLATKADAETILPSLDDVYNSENWEARLEAARAKRENIMAENANSKPISNAVPYGPLNNPEAASKGHSAPEVSMKDVLKTSNLNERLELAQKRHRQIQETQTVQPGFAFSRKSVAEFKKVVLTAAPAAVLLPATPDVEADQNQHGASLAVAVAPVAETSTSRGRKGLIAAILLLGLPMAIAGGVSFFQPDPGVAAQLPAPTITASPTSSATAAAIAPNSTVPDSAGTPDTAAVVSAAALPQPPVTEQFTNLQGIASYQPSELVGPLVVSAPIQQPPSWPVVSASAAAASPNQPDFLGGTANSIQLSAIPGANLAPALVLSNIGGLGASMPSITQNDVAWAGPASRLAPVNSQLEPTAALFVPLALPAPVAVPDEFVAISLQFDEPAHNALPIGENTVDLVLNPGKWLSDSPNVMTAIQPSRPSDQGAVPKAGEAPAAIIEASLPLTKSDTTGDTTAMFHLPPHSIRVFAPSSLDVEKSGAVVARIDGAGFDVSSVKPVGFSISSDNIRFYHSQDAETARALADLVGAEPRDFTDFSPRPPVGTVELWLAGAAAKATPRRTRRTLLRNSNNDGALQALRDRLVQRLRSGEHLGGG